MNLTCYGAYTNGKEFWLPSKELNALYYMNTSDGNLKYRGFFPSCLNDRAWNIKRVIEYHGELFFFSMHAYQVWKWNRAMNELKEYTCCSHPVNRITNVEIVRDQVWMIPDCFGSPIVFFDLQEKRGHLFQWNSKMYLNYGTGSFTRVVKSGVKLYFATRNKDDIHLCVLDCMQKTMSFKTLDTLSIVQCIGIDDDKLWVFGEDKQRKNVLQKYDINTLQKKISYELALPKKLLEKGGLSYVIMIVSGTSILLIPAWAKEIILFDYETKTEKIIRYPEIFYLELKKINGGVFNEIQKIDKKIYFMPYLIPQILALDMETELFEVWNEKVPVEECVKVFKHHFCVTKGMRIYESNAFSVNDFCALLQGTDYHIVDKRKDNIGVKAYRSI